MKKRYWLFGIIVLVVAVAAVSLAVQDTGENSEDPAPEEEAQLEEGEQGNAREETNDDSSDRENGQEAGTERQIHSATGMLTGRIDSGSVEIEIDGQPQAFALSDELREKEFASGAISFRYFVDENGRSVITQADFLEPREGEVHTAEVTFVGLADSHTAEVEMNGEARAFGLDENISFTGIDTGERIIIFYQENEQGRQEIIKIEKVF